MWGSIRALLGWMGDDCVFYRHLLRVAAILPRNSPPVLKNVNYTSSSKSLACAVSVRVCSTAVSKDRCAAGDPTWTRLGILTIPRATSFYVTCTIIPHWRYSSIQQNTYVYTSTAAFTYFSSYLLLFIKYFEVRVFLSFLFYLVQNPCCFFLFCIFFELVLIFHY